MLALPIFPGSRPWGLSAYMSLTSVFGMGSDTTAACGGYREWSEWQGSARDEGAPSPRTFAGHPNRKQVDTFTCSKIKVRPHSQNCEVFVLALPIFPGRPSIVLA